MWSGIQFTKLGPTTVMYSTSYEEAACDVRSAVYNHFGLNLQPQLAVRVFFVRNSTDYTIQDINGNPASALGWTCPGAYGVDTFNNIFISTATANSTTLAHEFGHALSLGDVNDLLCTLGPLDPLCALSWARDSTTHYPNLTYTNLMWSGSMFRDNITKAQAFRTNVNDISAVHRHQLLNRPLVGSARICRDDDPTTICPAIYVDK
jgi:hypothetical protein